LDRLYDVYNEIGRGMEATANELDGFAAREGGLRRDLDEGKTANFKLSCAKKDLGDQVHDLKCAAAEAEVELRRLKREAEDREAEHGRLEGSLCELQEERRKTAAEKLWLEQTVRKHEADVEKATAESRRLQNLVQERDAEVEGLKSNNLGLQSLVQQRQAEVEVAWADNARLQGLIRDKEAQISSLSALPITPLSPMGPPGPFSLPAAPLLQASPRAQTLPSRPSSPLPYIKQEPSDITPPAVVLPHQPAPVEQPQDPAQQLSQLGAGAADVLGKLLDIDHPIPHNNVLSSFLTNLGAAPEASSIAVTQAPVTGFWTLADPWTPNPTTTPPVLRPTLEEQFAHLCLLFPFPGTTTTHDATDHHDNSTETFRLLTALLTSLIRADHTASPRAGWAFRQSMSALGQSQTNLNLNLNLLLPHHHHQPFMSGLASTALLGTMLCELCRVLAHTFPGDGGGHDGSAWDLASVLGPGVYDALAGVGQPLARLAALLRDVDRFGGAAGADTGGGGDGGGDGARVLKEGLKGCGDGFCVFKHTPSPSLAPSPGSQAEEKDIGLLHCGGESSSSSSSSFFLMLDFGERSLRAVDCRLAGMRPNLAEPRKLDLIVARTGDTTCTQGREEEEEMFRVAAAPRDAAAFWVKYAMGDV
jgi:hypothetical protein